MGMSLHFEPVEVKQVVTDVDSQQVGAIKGRYILSEQNSGGNELHTFYPMNVGTLQLPVEGEVVMGTEFLGKYYYGQKLNFRNSEVANTQFNISSYYSQPTNTTNRFGKYLQEPSGSIKLLPHEGDTIIQGRFGNSIRLSCNQYEDYESGNKGLNRKFDESPNIKLVAGYNQSPLNLYTYEEDLTDELSSIYLTTNEEVPFAFKDRRVVKGTEPQITIQSDKIIFNGKTEFSVYSDSINLGDDKDLENAVLGNKLIEVLEEIVNVIENTNIGAGGGTLPLPFLGKLKSIISDKILSKNVKLK